MVLHSFFASCLEENAKYAAFMGYLLGKSFGSCLRGRRRNYQVQNKGKKMKIKKEDFVIHEPATSPPTSPCLQKTEKQLKSLIQRLNQTQAPCSPEGGVMAHLIRRKEDGTLLGASYKITDQAALDFVSQPRRNSEEFLSAPPPSQNNGPYPPKPPSRATRKDPA